MPKVKPAFPTDGYNWDTSKFIVFKTRIKRRRNKMTQEHDYKAAIEDFLGCIADDIDQNHGFYLNADNRGLYASTISAIKHALKIADDHQWYDIETAPKDGTRILAILDDTQVVTSWGKVSHVSMYGWLLIDTPYDPEDIELFYPTHWMPLPAAPNK